MVTATATRLRSLTDMARGLTQLRSHMRELGMTTSVWDNSGRMVGKLLPCCQLCQTIHEMNGSCQVQLQVPGSRRAEPEGAQGKP